MSLAHLHWEAGAFGRAQAVLQQSAEFCSDHPVRGGGHTLWGPTCPVTIALAAASAESGSREGVPAAKWCRGALRLSAPWYACRGTLVDCCPNLPNALQVWRLNLGHVLVAQEGGKLAEAAELYDSLVQHFAGGPGTAGAAGAAAGAAGAGGSLLEVPPSALANLCVCHVVGNQNEAAEDLLRRLEDEVAAATGGDSSQPDCASSASAAGGATIGSVPPHLSLTNLAIGTLYCAKGGSRAGVAETRRASCTSHLHTKIVGTLPRCGTKQSTIRPSFSMVHSVTLPSPQATLSLASRACCALWSRWLPTWTRPAGAPPCCAWWPCWTRWAGGPGGRQQMVAAGTVWPGVVCPTLP